MNEQMDRRASDFNTTDIVSISVALPTAAVAAYALARSDFTLMWIANGVLALATYFKVRSSRAKSMHDLPPDRQRERRDRRTDEAARA